jgi:hypothetical protein
MRRIRRQVHPSQAREMPISQGTGAVCALREMIPNFITMSHLKDVRFLSKSVSSHTTLAITGSFPHQRPSPMRR